MDIDETYNHIINEIKKININDLLHNKTNDKYINLVENIKKFNESVHRLSIPSSTTGIRNDVGVYDFRGFPDSLHVG